MFERILIWLQGYYIIRFDVNDIVQILNICNVSGIMLNSVKDEGDVYSARVNLKDFKNLEKACEKFGLTFDVKRKCGLRVFLDKCFAEKAFLAGAFLFAVLLFLASNISLEIKIKSVGDLMYISESEILQLAADCNIEKWRFIPLLDFDLAEEYIKTSSPYISFVGIARRGTEIVIEVKERKLLEAEEKPLPYGNIIAQCDGTIQNIFVLEGTALVETGQQVTAGQILISGERNGLPVPAEGIITAKVIYQGKAVVPFLQEKFYDTGLQANSLYLCWGNMAQLVIAGEADAPFEYFVSTDEKRKIEFLGYEMPFFLVQRTYTEQKVQQISLSYQEACDAAAELAYYQALSQLPLIGSEIVSKSLEISDNEAEAEAVVSIEVIRNFGIFKPHD